MQAEWGPRKGAHSRRLFGISEETGAPSVERGVSRGGVLEFFPKLPQLPVRHPFLGVSALWGLFLGSRRVVLGAAGWLWRLGVLS